MQLESPVTVARRVLGGRNRYGVLCRLREKDRLRDPVLPYLLPSDRPIRGSPLLYHNMPLVSASTWGA